jgi:hypothetical protein
VQHGQTPISLRVQRMQVAGRLQVSQQEPDLLGIVDVGQTPQPLGRMVRG